jgi:DNA modification methylase
VELTPEKEKELNIRLNKNTGQWDWDALANHFDVGELTEWGFSEDELQFTEPDVQGLTDDDDVPEVEEAITKQGDLWLLGEHRVLCGDATKKEDVERLMDGQKADMVFTDPPYGIDYDAKDQNLNNNNDYGKIKNDDGSLDLDFLFSDDTPIKIVWGANCFPSILPHRGRWICWYKRGDGAEKALGSPMELAWVDIGSGYDKHYKIVHGGFVNSDGGKRVHPTQKPTKLAMSIFDDYKAGTNIIDYFLGSGSTLIACEKTNRKCYGMEIDPHYCDVIVKRWEEYTGKKAERVEAASA